VLYPTVCHFHYPVLDISWYYIVFQFDMSFWIMDYLVKTNPLLIYFDLTYCICLVYHLNSVKDISIHKKLDYQNVVFIADIEVTLTWK